MKKGEHSCTTCRHYRCIQGNNLTQDPDYTDQWCEARSGIENLRTWPFQHTDCEHWEPPKEKRP